MKAYKLTDEHGRTYNNTQWGENITHTAKGDSPKLCTDAWIHFYTDPLIAILMNPTHANFKNPQLWEAESSGEELHESLKSGCKTLTTIKQIPIPQITLIQRIAFGILCAKQVCKDYKWNLWADKWLDGSDRTKKSAYASADAYAAYASASAYAYAAYDASIYASAASAYAANAADIADASAKYAADAANYATCCAISINFIELANKALTYK